MEPVTTISDNVEPAAPAATNRSPIRSLRLAMASIWTIVILVLCWVPLTVVEEVEDSSRWFDIPNLDKVIHWGMFVVFTVLWLRIGTARSRYAWVALAGVVMAVVTEMVQTVPWIGRDGNLDDGITDLIGLAIGMIAARWVEPLLRRLESRLLRGSTA